MRNLSTKELKKYQAVVNTDTDTVDMDTDTMDMGTDTTSS